MADDLFTARPISPGAGERQLLEALYRRQTETLQRLTALLKRMEALERACSKEENK